MLSPLAVLLDSAHSTPGTVKEGLTPGEPMGLATANLTHRVHLAVDRVARPEGVKAPIATEPRSVLHYPFQVGRPTCSQALI